MFILYVLLQHKFYCRSVSHWKTAFGRFRQTVCRNDLPGSYRWIVQFFALCIRWNSVEIENGEEKLELFEYGMDRAKDVLERVKLPHD